MIELPPAFVTQTSEREPAAAADWISRLPALVETYCARWAVTLDGPVWHGFCSVALPVHDVDGGPAVLRLGWSHDVKDRDAALALRTWAGAGAVLLLRHDETDQVSLLERLDHTRDLEGIAEDDEATEVLGRLLRRLTVPAPPGMRSLSDLADVCAADLEVGRRAGSGPLTPAVADRALGLLRDLAVSTSVTLANEDLHQQNVLAGEREPWLLIDPAPLVAAPEIASAPPLWNRWPSHVASGDVGASIRRRLTLLAEVAELDLALAAAWAYVRVAQNLAEPDHGEFDEQQLEIVTALERWT